MRVNELINILKTLPKNREIYISSDPEGNSFGTIESDSFSVEKECIIIFPIKNIVII